MAGLATTAPPPADAAGAFPVLLSGGIDMPSEFYFRGYQQADRGVILQPYLNVFTSRTLGEDVVIRPYVSLFHSSHPAAGNRMADMSDVMVGAIASAGSLTIDARYGYYTMNPLMPSDVHELGAKVSVDVLSALNAPADQGPFSLRPFAGVYAEVSDQHGTEDTYLTVGLEPTWRVEAFGQRVGVSLPLEWGLSADRYYFDADGDNAALGYFSAALTTSLALPERDGCGRWFLNTSIQYLDLIADSVRAVSGERDVWIGKVGVSFVF